MNRIITLGATAIGGVIAFQLLSKGRHPRLGEVLSRQMLRHMEHMMASLPDNSPPKLVMSVLPQLHDQNAQIIALLQEQNTLLHQHLEKPH